jgi:hypothetical protein
MIFPELGNWQMVGFKYKLLASRIGMLSSCPAPPWFALPSYTISLPVHSNLPLLELCWDESYRHL